MSTSLETETDRSSSTYTLVMLILTNKISSKSRGKCRMKLDNKWKFIFAFSSLLLLSGEIKKPTTDSLIKQARQKQLEDIKSGRINFHSYPLHVENLLQELSTYEDYEKAVKEIDRTQNDMDVLEFTLPYQFREFDLTYLGTCTDAQK